MRISEASLLDRNIDGDEHHVTLSDGSNWVVNPSDLVKLAKWVPTAIIAVDCWVDNSSFPYKLTNLDTEAFLLAMKI